MKTVFSAALLLAFVLHARAQGQITGACEVSSITTVFVSSTPSVRFPGKCDVKVNLSWEQKANNGNKYTYFHIWQQSSYQSFNYTNPANPPIAANLSASIGTVIVKDPSSTNPVLYDTYNPDPSYTKVLPLQGYGNVTLRKTVANNIDRFTVENVVLAGVDCNANNIYKFVGDVWSSQQSQGKNVHCVGKGNPFVINEVTNRSAMNCSDQNIGVQIVSATSNATGTYKIFADAGSFGSFDPSTDVLIATENFATSSTSLLTGAWPFTFTSSVSIPNAYRQNSFWVQVLPNGGVSTQAHLVNSTCALLPLTLTSFSVTRVRSRVDIKWQMLFEASSKGFNVQRKTDKDWETIAFVASKSPSGNSSVPVAYEYSDINPFRGVSQYRLVEFSLYGEGQASDTKQVRGESSLSKVTVYPNPSHTGRINVVFEKATPKEISVIDMTGRIVYHTASYKNNQLVLDLRQSGIYMVETVDKETGDVFQEKIIVQKP